MSEEGEKFEEHHDYENSMLDFFVVGDTPEDDFIKAIIDEGEGGPELKELFLKLIGERLVEVMKNPSEEIIYPAKTQQNIEELQKGIRSRLEGLQEKIRRVLV